MKYLQREDLSIDFPYKCCIISKKKGLIKRLCLQSKKKWAMVNQDRSGYAGFIYFNKVEEAIKFREKIYNNKDLYVLIQNDLDIIIYYNKKTKAKK